MIKWTKENRARAVKIFFVGFIIFIFVQSYLYKRSVLNNPYETDATITGIVNCYKNGRCVKYSYEYKGKKYTDEANSSWGFSNWCKDKNDCKGLKFRITLNKEDPHQNIAEWDDIFEKKQFVNYPENH